MTEGVPDSTLTQLAALVPAPVMKVCQVLQDAGFEAWTVGGAVRDSLLGRPIGDWDVATSAHPDEVVGLFRRTVPTGLQHGTVTVVMGAEHYPIEVTTFRGEGAYSDARRPDTVHFGVPLDDDLARRDFVINAIAFDPVARRMHDPFGGRADLARRVIRAVGDAGERFTEDGLRVMRAVRFAGQLEFSLDEATERAIPGALSSLARVAVERVHVELTKLLQSRTPSMGLAIAHRTGILEVIVPELSAVADHDAWRRTLVRVDGARDPVTRMASLLCSAADVDRLLRRLRASNDERRDVLRLCERRTLWQTQPEDGSLRRTMGEIGRAHLSGVVEMWRADARAQGDATACEPLCSRVRRILDAGDALTVAELAVTGGALMSQLGIAPGRLVGVLLRGLHDRVLADPSLNRPDALMAIARELATEPGS